MFDQSHVSGVILAGGKSSRMGTDKALLEIDGKPMIVHVVEMMKSVFTSVLISVNDARDYEFLNLPIVEDMYKNCGPMGGLHAALTRSISQQIFVIACDTPFVPREVVFTILEQVDDSDVVIAEIDGKIEPLLGAYSRNCLISLQKHLTSGRYKMAGFLQEQKTRIIQINSRLPFYHPSLFRNFNSTEDFRRLRMQCKS